MVFNNATVGLFPGAQAAKDGSWGTWKPTWLCGPSLQHSTVGFFGFGRIGHAVSKSIIQQLRILRLSANVVLLHIFKCAQRHLELFV